MQLAPAVAMSSEVHKQELNHIVLLEIVWKIVPHKHVHVGAARTDAAAPRAGAFKAALPIRPYPRAPHPSQI